MSVRSAVHQTSVASKRKTSVLPNRRKKLSKMRSGKLRRFLIFVNDFDVCRVLCVVCCVVTEHRTGRSPKHHAHHASYSTVFSMIYNALWIS